MLEAIDQHVLTHKYLLPLCPFVLLSWCPCCSFAGPGVQLYLVKSCVVGLGAVHSLAGAPCGLWEAPAGPRVGGGESGTQSL